MLLSDRDKRNIARVYQKRFPGRVRELEVIPLQHALRCVNKVDNSYIDFMFGVHRIIVLKAIG